MLQPTRTMTDQIAEIDRRRSDRSDVSIPTQVLLKDRSLVAANIENLSAGGAFVRLACSLPERAIVKLDIPGLGWLPSTIVWSLNDMHGLEFETPLERFRLRTLASLFASGA
jgi:hypothetical protein